MPFVILFGMMLGFVLHGIGAAADGIAHLIDVITNAAWLHAAWDAIAGWFHSAPAIQMTPQLRLGNEALYAQFQQLMDTQFQVGELKRTILTLPALPGEGY